MGNIKMDNVVIDGKTYSYDGTQDSEDDDTPTEKPTSHKNEL